MGREADRERRKKEEEREKEERLPVEWLNRPSVLTGKPGAASKLPLCTIKYPQQDATIASNCPLTLIQLIQ